MAMIPGEKSGLRINSKGGIVGVHPGTVAHTAGLLVGDVVTAVDGTAVEVGSTSHSALQLWTDGRERSTRRLRVRRDTQSEVPAGGSRLTVQAAAVKRVGVEGSPHAVAADSPIGADAKKPPSTSSPLATAAAAPSPSQAAGTTTPHGAAASPPLAAISPDKPNTESSTKTGGEVEISLRVIEGARIGLRMNAQDEICAVHFGSVAHAAGVQARGSDG